MCVYYITNIIINRQHLLSSSTVASLSLPSGNLYPLNCITHTVVDDTFHTEREWPYLSVTDSGRVSYKMEYSILYDNIILYYNISTKQFLDM